MSRSISINDWRIFESFSGFPFGKRNRDSEDFEDVLFVLRDHESQAYICRRNSLPVVHLKSDESGPVGDSPANGRFPPFSIAFGSKMPKTVNR